MIRPNEGQRQPKLVAFGSSLQRIPSHQDPHVSILAASILSHIHCQWEEGITYITKGWLVLSPFFAAGPPMCCWFKTPPALLDHCWIPTNERSAAAPSLANATFCRRLREFASASRRFHAEKWGASRLSHQEWAIVHPELVWQPLCCCPWPARFWPMCHWPPATKGRNSAGIRLIEHPLNGPNICVSKSPIEPLTMVSRGSWILSGAAHQLWKNFLHPAECPWRRPCQAHPSWYHESCLGWRTTPAHATVGLGVATNKAGEREKNVKHVHTMYTSVHTSNAGLPKINRSQYIPPGFCFCCVLSNNFGWYSKSGSTNFLGLFGTASSSEFRTHGPQGFKPCRRKWH